MASTTTPYPETRSSAVSGVSFTTCVSTHAAESSARIAAAALSALLSPARASVWMTWRCRLDTETRS